MLVLTCKNLEKSFGTDNIFNNINFNVEEGDKVGLVGNNGSGKTTLFNILTGELEADSGEIYVRSSYRLGHLQQHVSMDSNKSMFQECLQVFQPLVEMEQDLRRMEEEIAQLSLKDKPKELDALMDNYSHLSEKFTQLNGYGYESSIRGTLIGLGFTEDDFDKKMNILSGGQKSRVSLAKLLLEKPDILLLDEPTNHLDIPAIDWLAKYIQDYSGAAIIISHDRYFLDMVVNKIIHLEHKTTKEYRTNYTNFIKRRKENIEIYKRHYEDKQKLIEKEKKIIEQYRAFGGERYNRLAKSREKMLEKINAMDEYMEEGQIRFKFKPKLESGTDVLQVEELGKNFGPKNLFENISFNIYKPERVGLIGPNGVGKSTLFKIILDQIQDYQGSLKLGHHVHPGYFDQEMSSLNDNNTVIDEIWDDNPKLSHTEIRTALSQFMFLGDDVFKEVKDLSGGEKGRLSILKLIMSKDNFLLMDEPTNHLDIDSKEVLEEALLDYEGTVFVISHDRYFLNRVVDKILLMTPNGMLEYLGNYDYYMEKVAEQKNPLPESPDRTKTQIKEDRKREKELLNQEKKKNKKLKDLEASIGLLEVSIQKIDQALANNAIYEDTEKVMELTAAREEKSQELEKAYDKWIEITDI